MGETASEKLFEKFLDASGYTGKWDYEPEIAGQQQKPDYRLSWKGRNLFFEVKELRGGGDLTEGVTWLDPYTHIRDEINEAARKFKSLRNEVCCVVLQNIDDNEVRLEPPFVLAAMLGNLGSQMDFDAESGVADISTVKNAFLGADKSSGRPGGKMLNPHSGKPQNTRISAIVVLDIYRDTRRVDRVLKARISAREQDVGREVLAEEVFDIANTAFQEYGDSSRNVPRVVVIDNPVARKPFPQKVFEGDFDERWRWDPNTGHIVRTFRGAALEAKSS